MLLEFATKWFTPIICLLGVFHLLAYAILRISAQRHLRSLAQSLERFTDGIGHRSRLDWRGHLTDQIDAFVEDVREAVKNPTDRDAIGRRMSILDEQRSYLDSYRFETAWNVARSGIEIYPLLGVLGTIFALWLAMRQPIGDATATVGVIVERFGLAIDSTFAGLAMAIVLIVVNSFCETMFVRLLENRRAVRELVTDVKRELIAADCRGVDAT
ncbi:MotA/TolQ/ExbB proton channel family protein [Novipirellula artificiosorum]|uniref:MotA/TolQ/ExbB proton channel family protein n=1 Tax=Novipirellula artificiosorum TaxID=2528016 RepID=A0A5C6E2X7_9BACT|nr:MotA/TolQ/ExbB proton channel family protein [Novipirellula artificiosorum]TWU42317.1 MotA/TolQ/ExbB proton channel family protein [Novipirellula artificiosorum]